ncbi:MAG: pyridoxal-phosphate dependent enzyme [Acidimicrobiia bacterium]|nr:pyridoxal-phosphate dependent enzyme [Acidimicrobiia bacterium]
MADHPTASDVRRARDRIAGTVRATPLRPAPALGAGVHLKLENRQVTGSFKIRGAANALAGLSADERARGVVTVSSGNHGRAVAAVAAESGVPATICLSERVPDVKREAIATLGARVVVAGPSQDDADAEARRLVAADGLTFVHPFDDPAVIAGQGTVGLEIVEALPDVRTVVVPLSGGGLLSGIALAVKAHDPAIRVVGVSQDRGPAMHDSLRAGRLTEVVEEDTLADALAGGLGPENRHTFALCRRLLDDVVLVTEAEIGAAMAWLHDEEGERVEGGGAVGVAALRAGRAVGEGLCVVVVSGGNVADETLQTVIGAAA